MTKEVKLLGMWASPYSRRVELALRLKGLEFEYVEELLNDKSPLLLESNPIHKKVPVLIHNGKPVSESMVILEYLDEAWPTNHPLLPKDPHQRAMARFWAKFVDDTLLQTARKSVSATGKELDDIFEQVCQHLELLQEELIKGKEEFFGGEAIGLVDIMLFYMVNTFQIRQEATGVVFFREERFPVLYKWIARLSEMEVVKESSAPRDKHLAYVRARLPAEAARGASK